jgi:fimbrial chaperone protein
MKLRGASLTLWITSIWKCRSAGKRRICVAAAFRDNHDRINEQIKMALSPQIKTQYTRLKQRSSATALALIASVFCGMASAGTFTVTPVRIYMTPKDRATAITITNDGDEELVMQADLYDWKQKPDGSDDLKLTEDIFLSPPIIKMAPKSRQVVRLARLVPTQSTSQITYRMIVREIPEAKPPSENIQVQLALAFSMPVFITPPGVKPKLGCTIERVAANSVNAVCENTGNAYSHPVALLLNSAAGEKIADNPTAGYILPGIKRSFTIKREGAAIPAGAAKLVATLDDGTTETYAVTIAE